MKVYPGSSFLQITQGVSAPGRAGGKPPSESGQSFSAALRGSQPAEATRQPARAAPVEQTTRSARPQADTPRGAVLDIKV